MLSDLTLPISDLATLALSCCWRRSSWAEACAELAWPIEGDGGDSPSLAVAASRSPSRSPGAACASGRCGRSESSEADGAKGGGSFEVSDIVVRPSSGGACTRTGCLSKGVSARPLALSSALSRATWLGEVERESEGRGRRRLPACSQLAVGCRGASVEVRGDVLSAVARSRVVKRGRELEDRVACLARTTNAIAAIKSHPTANFRSRLSRSVSRRQVIRPEAIQSSSRKCSLMGGTPVLSPRRPPEMRTACTNLLT